MSGNSTCLNGFISSLQEKGDFERRQKKEFMDGTICSECLEGGKCYFKGTPENF